MMLDTSNDSCSSFYEAFSQREFELLSNQTSSNYSELFPCNESSKRFYPGVIKAIQFKRVVAIAAYVSAAKRWQVKADSRWCPLQVLPLGMVAVHGLAAGVSRHQPENVVIKQCCRRAWQKCAHLVAGHCNKFDQCNYSHMSVYELDEGALRHGLRRFRIPDDRHAQIIAEALARRPMGPGRSRTSSWTFGTS